MFDMQGMNWDWCWFALDKDGNRYVFEGWKIRTNGKKK